VRGASADAQRNRARQRQVVDAFLAASRGGDFAQLVALLDPNVVLRADRHAVESAAARQERGAPKLAPEIRGANGVAEALFGRAGAAVPARIDGSEGAAWAPGGRTRAAFRFTIDGDTIVGIEIVSDPERLQSIEIVL
jgi:RNA polymerase sigma-70 factor (ECF subfamily)